MKASGKKEMKIRVIEKIDRFVVMEPLLSSAYEETKTLSKKKQDGVLNKLKVGMINKLLVQFRSILNKEAMAEYLELLDEETLPTNSDAVFIIGQYIAAIKSFRVIYYKYDEEIGEDRWFIENIEP